MSKDDIERRRSMDRTRKRLRDLDKLDEAQGKPPWRLLEWTEKEDKKMARGRKPATPVQALKLNEALTFVAVANRDTGEGDYQSHLQFVTHPHLGQQVVAWDGVIAAGHCVEEALTCCPHRDRLRAALAKCGNSLNLTQLDSGRLSVKGQKLRAIVPCLPADQMFPAEPDAPIAPLNDDVKAALVAVAKIISEAATDVIEASILIDGTSVFATNKKIILEAWHGVELPPRILVPRLFVAALAKQSKKLVSFGWNASQNADGEWQAKSVTFHFEEGAWIKTLCYVDPYPDVAALVGINSFPKEVPEDLLEAVEACGEQTEEDAVYFVDNLVMSHRTAEVGSQYDVKGLAGDKGFPPKQLLMLAPFLQLMDATTYADRMTFSTKPDHKPAVRGVIMGVKATPTAPAPDAAPAPPVASGWGVPAAVVAAADNGYTAPEPTYAEQAGYVAHPDQTSPMTVGPEAFEDEDEEGEEE